MPLVVSHLVLATLLNLPVSELITFIISFAVDKLKRVLQRRGVPSAAGSIGKQHWWVYIFWPGVVVVLVYG